ncbi:MAG: hypothetical protein ACLVH8_09595 [Fusobacterium sp.]
MLKDLKAIVKLLGEIKELLKGNDEMSELEKEYREYKFFADSRGEKLLAENGLLDEYNEFMTAAEEIIFADEKVSTFALKIELPKPSPALEKFKNRFNKFF